MNEPLKRHAEQLDAARNQLFFSRQAALKHLGAYHEALEDQAAKRWDEVRERLTAMQDSFPSGHRIPKTDRLPQILGCRSPEPAWVMETIRCCGLRVVTERRKVPYSVNYCAEE